jgi:hypothetical protein
MLEVVLMMMMDSILLPFCANIFSNAVGIPTIIAKVRNDVNTLKLKVEIILFLIYQIVIVS